MSGKTEEPSPRRLAKAKALGDVPFSSEAVRSVTLAVGIAGLPALAAISIVRLLDLLRRAYSADLSPHEALEFVARDLAVILIPWLLALALAASVAAILQTRGAVRAAFARKGQLSMGSRSLERTARFIVGATVALAYLVVLGLLLKGHVTQLADVTSDAGAALGLATNMTQKIALFAVATALTLGALDATFAYVLWRERLYQTRAEAERERLEAEGDKRLIVARHAEAQASIASATRAHTSAGPS